MTISTTTNTVTYVGNGSAATFAFNFKVLDADHLVVQRLLAADDSVDKTYVGTEITVTGIGESSGSVTIVAGAPSSTYKIKITRVVPYTQDADLLNQGGYYPEVVENQLDLMVMQTQQLANIGGDESWALEAQQAAADAAASASDAQGHVTTASDFADEAEAAQVAAELAQSLAEDARDAAVAADGLYADTAAGIAGTVHGQVFGIPSADADGSYDLWENDTEVAVDLNKTVPSLALVRALNVQLNSPFENDISATHPYLDAVITKIVLFNAKAHDYRVSLFGTDVTRFRIHIWDEEQADQVAYIDLNPVTEYGSYAAMAATRIPLTGLDPVGGDYTGMTGYVEIDINEVVQDASVIQPASFAAGGIKRTNVHTRFSVRDKHPGEAFQEVIPWGVGETYTTPLAAAESVYDEPLADPMGIAVIPTCERATPLHRILLLGMPGTYTAENVHLPDYVSLGAVQRGAVEINHAPGATLPMIQAHINHEIFDLVFRTTVDDEYAVHSDYAHLYMTADSEGDYNREFYLRFRRNQWIVGAGMNYQPYGSGIPINMVVEFDGDEFISESSVFAAPFAAAHNADTPGGARFIFRNCVDKSGRTNVSTVIVQTTFTNTYKSFLEIWGCPSFNGITAHESVVGVTNAWNGVGDYAGTVYVDQTTFPGEVLEFSSVAWLLNSSGSEIAAGKAVVRGPSSVTGLVQDGGAVDAIAFDTVANGAFGRFFVARQVDERMIGFGGATTGWCYVANGVLTTSLQASGVPVGRFRGGVLFLS